MSKGFTSTIIIHLLWIPAIIIFIMLKTSWYMLREIFFNLSLSLFLNNFLFPSFFLVQAEEWLNV